MIASEAPGVPAPKRQCLDMLAAVACEVEAGAAPGSSNILKNLENLLNSDPATVAKSLGGDLQVKLHCFERYV